jgi:DNA-binding CsgD family transcriptional regulator
MSRPASCACARAACYVLSVNTSLRTQSRPADRLADFGDRTVELVCDTLAAEWGAFFLLDQTVTAHGFRVRGAPTELPLSYAAQAIEHNDPLHPRRLIPERRRFTTIFDPSLVGSSRERHDRARFWAFLQSFGATDAAEMIFWCGDRAVGGISLIWRNRTSRCRDLALARSLQSYIEFNFPEVGDTPAPEPPAGDSVLGKLTRREYHVANLACRGYTNSEIARRLGISLATVKTHLIHIFGKTEVDNRVALARYMATRTS